jgi:DNA-binding CsgD family transcriptional regulator
MLTGKETAEISEGLCVSKKTISNICSSLKKKLNVSSAVDLYKLAEQFDLVNKG